MYADAIKRKVPLYGKKSKDDYNWLKNLLKSGSQNLNEHEYRSNQEIKITVNDVITLYLN